MPSLLLLFSPLLMPQASPSDPPSNHLIHETSPYLLAHAHNPVDWYPWGEEALERAKREDKPIFLSIGYSACHWCHVMERESFENEDIAALLNRNFICIKVDREERPDLDDLYMSAVQRMTGSGGWPMSVWLTPELLPFYGGTYFPPESRYGRPGFKEVLAGLAEAWQVRREDIETAAKSLGEALEVNFPAVDESLSLPQLADVHHLEQEAVDAYAADFDPTYGGFGGAPKFPRTADLRLLLAVAARQGDTAAGQQALAMATTTLKAMAAGGMYDRLAGGFARYSVDAAWRIPHFEKMLYDQGTLIPAYLEGWRLSGDEHLAAVARATADYLLRERQSPQGAFWSSTDADSEGVEGKYFVWTPAQLEEVLGEVDARFAAALYGVTEKGNFEHGQSALLAAATPAEAAKIAGVELATAEARAEDIRARLLAARAQRIPPHSDDKILLSWNGLAIGALARAGRMLAEPRFTAAAAQAADFLIATMRDEDGHWWRSTRLGKVAHHAVLEDLAYFDQGLLELFMSTGEARWLEQAEAVASAMLEAFGDEESGILWDSDGHDQTLLHRLKSPWDGATPSPNAVAIESLLMLHAFTGEEAWREAAVRDLRAVHGMVTRQPRSFASTLRLYAWAAAEPAVAVVIGTGSADSLRPWQAELATAPYADTLPVLCITAAPDSTLSLFTGRVAREGKATLYRCVGQVCDAPRTLE